jgi:hypothetical protein
MERRFSETQVTEIIRRAAEASAVGRTTKSGSVGIPESEVRRIASELGIAGPELDHALSEAGLIESSESGTGSSLERVIERTVPAELDFDQTVRVLEEFVPVSGFQGSQVQAGKTINYKSLVGLSECQVTVNSRRGRTKLRVKSNAGLCFIPTFIPFVMGSIIAMAGIWDEMQAAAGVKWMLTVAIVGGLGTLAWFGRAALTRWTNRKVLELTERAASHLEEEAQYMIENPDQQEIRTHLEDDREHVEA